MSITWKFMFSALLAPLLGGAVIYAAEFEVVDKFSVDGYSVLRGSADIPGGGFAVGGSTFAVKDGKVGIGTASPAYQLDVAGDIRIGNANYLNGRTAAGLTTRLLGINTIDAAYIGSVDQAINSLFLLSGPSEVILAYDAPGDILKLKTGNTDRLTIDAAGNVGIGTASPAAPLHVVPGTDGNPQLLLSRRSGAFGLQITAYSSIYFKTKLSDSLTWQTFMQACEGCASGSSHLLLQPTAGNVGVGTTAPAATLDVGGTGAIKMPVGSTAERPAGVRGMMRFNSENSSLEVYNGSKWLTFFGDCSAAGGSVVKAGGYCIHTFTASGTFQVATAGNVEVLVVAGGGGGGAGWYAGGGGAGGLIYNAAFAVTAQTYTITVGAGGAGSTSVVVRGANGENSVFSSLTAVGGGCGGSRTAQQSGVSGGSGGGASWPSTAGGAGTAQQGNAGGTNAGGNYGASGGGAGAAGLAGNASPYGRDGAIGAEYSISGTATYYAGGGAGGSDSSLSRIGGLGGGGRASNTTIAAGNGTPNTGGGGGGGSSVEGSGGSGIYERGGNGGSGIVIIKYLN